MKVNGLHARNYNTPQGITTHRILDNNIRLNRPKVATKTPITDRN